MGDAADWLYQELLRLGFTPEDVDKMPFDFALSLVAFDEEMTDND
jgi:hypothetical protein